VGLGGKRGLPVILDALYRRLEVNDEDEDWMEEGGWLKLKTEGAGNRSRMGGG